MCAMLQLSRAELLSEDALQEADQIVPQGAGIIYKRDSQVRGEGGEHFLTSHVQFEGLVPEIPLEFRVHQYQ